MTSVSFTIGGAVINALDLAALISPLVSLQIMVKKNAKDMI